MDFFKRQKELSYSVDTGLSSEKPLKDATKPAYSILLTKTESTFFGGRRNSIQETTFCPDIENAKKDMLREISLVQNLGMDQEYMEGFAAKALVYGSCLQEDILIQAGDCKTLYPEPKLLADKIINERKPIDDAMPLDVILETSKEIARSVLSEKQMTSLEKGVGTYFKNLGGR